MSQIMTPYLFFDDEVGDFKELGSQADGSAMLEHHSYLNGSIRPMHDETGMGSTALPCSPEKDEPFSFLTDMFLSHCYSLIYSARL